LQIERFSIK